MCCTCPPPCLTPAPAPGPHPAAPRPPLQVLSVDDDPVNQMVIQTMLTKAGFKVLKAPDGQKALDMLEVGAGCYCSRAGNSRSLGCRW